LVGKIGFGLAHLLLTVNDTVAEVDDLLNSLVANYYYYYNVSQKRYDVRCFRHLLKTYSFARY